jgi:hypothetical protein
MLVPLPWSKLNGTSTVLSAVICKGDFVLRLKEAEEIRGLSEITIH